MLHTVRELIQSYKDEVAPISQSDLSDTKNLITGIELSQTYLHKLRDTIKDRKFETQQDEIQFFKTEKPFIYGRLKFYVKLYKYASYKPNGSIKKQRAYIDQLLDKLQAHNTKNIDFISYFRQGETTLDKYYFVRGKDKIALISDTSHYYTDPEFSSSHDNTVAQIIAHDFLVQYYNQELHRLRKKELNVLKEEENNYAILNDLSWTSSKTNLVELIYALQASGSIRDGQAEIKKMAMVCEKLFDL